MLPKLILTLCPQGVNTQLMTHCGQKGTEQQQTTEDGKTVDTNIKRLHV